MKLITEISDQSLGLSEISPLNTSFTLRKSARAILFNEHKKIALQHIGLFDYYKLPGGGIEKGETVESALRRELLEEVGCEVEIISLLGVVVEYRQSDHIIHVSYGYHTKVVGEFGKPAFDKNEIASKQETVWVDIFRARDMVMASTRPEEAFIKARESAFSNEFLATNIDNTFANL